MDKKELAEKIVQELGGKEIFCKAGIVSPVCVLMWQTKKRSIWKG